jgi:hypothetical protein
VYMYGVPYREGCVYPFNTGGLPLNYSSNPGVNWRISQGGACTAARGPTGITWRTAPAWVATAQRCSASLDHPGRGRESAVYRNARSHCCSNRTRAPPCEMRTAYVNVRTASCREDAWCITLYGPLPVKYIHTPLHPFCLARCKPQETT